MKCPSCKAEMVLGKAILPFEFAPGKIIVVTNVPALICEQCGEEYIEMNIVRKVEQIIEKVRNNGIQMGFVRYEQAA